MPNADELVVEARQHLQRLTPRAAADALADGALVTAEESGSIGEEAFDQAG